MPFTVITLKNVPPSLRGDLTKCMQEISAGVYIGNFSTRIREYLWKRICDSAGTGACTLSYAYHNEIGYQFQTFHSDRSSIDSDGIPLVLLPVKRKEENEQLKRGFSSAYKLHKILQASAVKPPAKENIEVESKTEKVKQYVFLDIETTGLNPEKDSIIEIGALYPLGDSLEEFHRFIQTHQSIPKEIIQLTGITDKMLQCGVAEETALKDLLTFLDKKTIVGYNIKFDINFLNASLNRQGLTCLSNQVVDLLELVRKEQLFQANYRLATSLKAYGIEEEVPHRALEDARLIYRLAEKLNIF